MVREIEPEDRFEKLGAMLVKEITSRAYDVAGDGTTTSTVVARAIFAERSRLVAAGFDPMSLKRGIDVAVAAVLTEISRIAAPVQDAVQIAHVATIAANGIVRQTEHPSVVDAPRAMTLTAARAARWP